MISYVFHGKNYKGKCQMCALQHSCQLDSLFCELFFFFSPFSFRNTATVFLPYYCFRFSAFACSPNSGFFLQLVIYFPDSLLFFSLVIIVTLDNWYNSALCSFSLHDYCLQLVWNVQVKNRMFRLIFSSNKSPFLLKETFWLFTGGFTCKKENKGDYSEASFRFISSLVII